jgi:hypothetical protein
MPLIPNDGLIVQDQGVSILVPFLFDAMLKGYVFGEHFATL